MTEASNPRKSDHARAETEIDLQGRLIRAHASAPSMEAAVDAVTKRLQQQLRRHVERLITPIALETAIADMNVVHHRSLFFENAANRRGNIIYRSNDGNYGLIEPA
ncbi:MAG: sigma 54 modulation/S30EA ribosomal C-terminal domain-containing protein [Solirubrobacteraceae bacterium]